MIWQGSGYGPGRAPLERLPNEVLNSIINILALDVLQLEGAAQSIDLLSLLLTSRALHTATLEILYSHISFPHSRAFHKFLNQISARPAIGTSVRRLDFCRFNASSLFSTARERARARNLTSETLLRCLSLTPHLMEFLAHEQLVDDLDARVFHKLFCSLDRLKAVDLCGCSSSGFKVAVSSSFISGWPPFLPIERLSLHECITLPAAVFEALHPRMPRLTHLDLAGTRVTNAALASIPPTARITHLNVAKCRSLSADFLIQFFSSHPAVVDHLVWLSVATDARTFELFNSEQLSRLIPILPKTLRSLSLKGSKMSASHIEQLRPKTKSLEELALGRSIDLRDVNRLLMPDKNSIDEQTDWLPRTLRYLDLSDMWDGEMDLFTLFGKDCAVLSRYTVPLEIIEVSDDVARRLNMSSVALARAGWRLSELRSRTWIFRERKGSDNTSQSDTGRRAWKMGVERWGMRKIPVAHTEVGGMYRYYMFGRNL